MILSHLSRLGFNNLKKIFKISDLNKIIKFMLTDKKNTSKKINFITLEKIGSVNINNQLNASQVRNFLKLELLK